MTTVQAELTEASCVIRRTHLGRGRSVSLRPGKGAVKYLHYGRIILDGDSEPLRFSTEDRETGLVCLKGSASVRLQSGEFELSLYDALYVPRDSQSEVTAGASGCDLAELSAPVETAFPAQYVAFQKVRNDPGLHFKTGGPGSTRDLNILLGKNVEAGRIVAGVTFSEPGNWTSWPPHEHAELLEEAYLFIDMPKPSWGVQFVYTDPMQPELMVAVREGDCVVMPRGYHPNVAAPGNSINFLWMMAAHREKTDRLFGVVNVQPEYMSSGSGLEIGRAE